MTIETTLPHGLKTSAFGSQYKTEYDGNLALLDPDRITSGLFANRPAPGTAKRFYYATDNGNLYYDSGTAWVQQTLTAGAHAATHASGGADAITLAESQVTGLVADLAGKEPANANIQTHIAASAPHTGHEVAANKGAANGYAALGAGGRVPIAQLASGTPDGTKFIRDDGTLQVPPGSSGGAVSSVFGRTGAVVKSGSDYAVADITGAEATANKDATGGYAGLTLFKINFKNAANTFTNFFANATTAARTYTFQDRSGTIADDTDLALKAPLVSPALVTPTITGVTDGSSATAGKVGEYISSAVQGITIGNSYVAVTSISLTAGDWDISAQIGNYGAGGNAWYQALIGTTSASSAGATRGLDYFFGLLGAGGAAGYGASIFLRKRVTISSTTAYYLNAAASTTNDTFDGFISARRVR